MSVFACYHLHDLKDNEIFAFYQQKMNVRGEEYKDVKIYSKKDIAVLMALLCFAIFNC